MKVQREKVEQAHIVQLLRTVGATVYVLGTRRPKGDYQGTRQTPGIPDLLAFLPARGAAEHGRTQLLLFVEAKAAGGRLRPEQRVFRELCLFARVVHLVGDYNTVVNWCVEHGYVAQNSVPHYRLSKAAAPKAAIS